MVGVARMLLLRAEKLERKLKTGMHSMLQSSLNSR